MVEKLQVLKLQKKHNILACANAVDTNKCKLLVIGESAKPCAFKGIKTSPSVHYIASKNVWET